MKSVKNVSCYLKKYRTIAGSKYDRLKRDLMKRIPDKYKPKGERMRSISVCFTGHRKISAHKLDGLKKDLTMQIEALIERGFRHFYCGGALGYDTLAGYTVLELREKYPDIKLHIILACVGQDQNWGTQDRERHRKLISAADGFYFMEILHEDGCILKRNQYLVNHSAVCLAYLEHMRSGTSQTVRVATEQGLEIINLAKK